jgi:hypothetical protein
MKTEAPMRACVVQTGGRGESGDGLEVRLVGRMREAAARIVPGGRPRKDDVVAHPQGRDAVLLRLLGEREQGLARGHRSLGGKVAADLHP